MLTNSEISHRIDEYIRNERNRRLLKRRFIDGIRFEPLAEEFDLSVTHTKTIVNQAQKIIFGKAPHENRPKID